MTETTWATLRQLLVDRYDDLRRHLARRLESEELARETLHETWLRLDRTGEVASIKSPTGYLLRTALNIAVDRRRADSRLARPAEIAAVLEVADPASDPAAQAEGRMEIAALELALQELTPRRRAILLASRLDGTTLRQIAAELGISQRLVEMELKHALDHCAQRLGRKVVRLFGPRSPETS
ncbi:sigma-70 family RNA polymerase sigma factor [Hyphomicrobium sp. xq]|uniref:Sigma-70 family RNA polymerase sigma factor n=1 Tax=Hyphomicrobium album TaxID=2665159 RepID=A0A6I3KP50_9HYPH|nr:sigma-70 family RNA polymerase sigma factor [Hyphomicrobium album]MTD96299.1 sigma-70 family RNA polymerase sigma factor [Hyphomicrobium album]